MRTPTTSRLVETNVPGLLQLQEDSFTWFLQQDKTEGRELTGLQQTLGDLVVGKDPEHKTRTVSLRYSCDNPMVSPKDCRCVALTYGTTLWLHCRLMKVTDAFVESEAEETTSLGTFPLLTPVGSFVVNGSDKAIISQLDRAPGLYVENAGTKQSEQRFVRIIPKQGQWVDLKQSPDKTLAVRVGRTKEVPVANLLNTNNAFAQNLWDLLNGKADLFVTQTRCFLLGSTEVRSSADVSEGNGVVELKDLRCAELGDLASQKDNVRPLAWYAGCSFPLEILHNLWLPQLNQTTRTRSQDVILLLRQNQQNSILFQKSEHHPNRKFFQPTIASCKTIQTESHNLRSRQLESTLPTSSGATKELCWLLSGDAKCRLSEIGRKALDCKIKTFGFHSLDLLSTEDVVCLFEWLAKANGTNTPCHDLDDLAGKVLCQVGELLMQHLNLILLRRKQPNRQPNGNVAIGEQLIPSFAGVEAIGNALCELIASSQQTQFLDQTNPLSRITHTRRVAALRRETSSQQHASLAARDVHQSYHSKICPVETPEGQSIGLVNSLATHAAVDPTGILKAPYRPRSTANSDDTLLYHTAAEEENLVIAPFASSGTPKVLVRKASDTLLVAQEDVHLTEAFSSQTVSVATSLIPFLEHNDVNRALMGSNMQRQVVPCSTAERPIVCTGIEKDVANDTGCRLTAQKQGTVIFEGPTTIVTQSNHKTKTAKPAECPNETDRFIVNTEIYNLSSFADPNHCIAAGYHSVTKRGADVRPGDLLGDSITTTGGELTLGHNVLVAFMPWYGFNFEDSVVVCESLVQKNKYSSVHLEEFVVPVRWSDDCKEETTRNVRTQEASNLDANGIIVCGSKIQPGTLLVGKRTPTALQLPSSEAKLLRTIFNERLTYQQDTSAYAPGHTSGIVIAIQVSTLGSVQDEARTTPPKPKVRAPDSATVELAKQMEATTVSGWKELLYLQEANLFALVRSTNQECTKNEQHFLSVDPFEWLRLPLETQYHKQLNKACTQVADAQKRIVQESFGQKNYLKERSKLPVGVVRLIKITVLSELKLQAGDKMSGRHGNKGVVSRVVPAEDMPYLGDGKPIDVVLNPLGVPSRMNIGQLLETHLSFLAKVQGKRVAMLAAVKPKQTIGWCCDMLLQVSWKTEQLSLLLERGLSSVVQLNNAIRQGVCFVLAPFSHQSEVELVVPLKQLVPLKVRKRENLTACRTQAFLRDGTTGELFHAPTTVGYLYYFKLYHLAETKLHVRSTGPYSAVTQQPLRGKARSGGQRFGEMEVWALEAHGAAYNLQEMLTVKSDDVVGRQKVCDATVQDNLVFSTGTPEAFNVLTKELRALGVDLSINQ